MEIIEAAYWAGAGAILLLTMVIFVDKKCYTELMKELKLENQTIKKNTKEQCERVDEINERLLK